MFQKDINYLESEESWNTAVDSVWSGRKFWLQLIEKYNITRKSRVVIVNSLSYEYNYYTLAFLNELKKRYNLEHIYVVSALKEIDELVEKAGVSEVIVERAEQHIIDDLCRLYRLYKFTDQIIFNMYDDVCDANAENCAKFWDIDIEEIVAISILGLEEVPQVTVDSIKK